MDTRCQLTESGEWHTELKSNLKTGNSKPLQVPSITSTLIGRTSTTFWSGFNIIFFISLLKNTEEPETITWQNTQPQHPQLSFANRRVAGNKFAHRTTIEKEATSTKYSIRSPFFPPKMYGSESQIWQLMKQYSIHEILITKRLKHHFFAYSSFQCVSVITRNTSNQKPWENLLLRTGRRLTPAKERSLQVIKEIKKRILKLFFFLQVSTQPCLGLARHPTFKWWFYLGIKRNVQLPNLGFTWFT